MGNIRITSDTLTPGLEQLSPNAHSGITALVEYFSDVAEGHMRRNAPWTDRTTNARNGLFAQAFTDPEQYVILLYHTMPYGIWLEVRWSGRYAIILPTVETVGPQMMRQLQKLLRRI